MHAIINNFHNNRLTTSRKNFREISWLVFFRQFVQGIISLANLRKSVRYLGRGVKKATQTTAMISSSVNYCTKRRKFNYIVSRTMLTMINSDNKKGGKA